MDTSVIKPIGRFLIKDDHFYFFNGGSGFAFKMDGNSFSVSLASRPIQGYFYIVIDRDFNNKIKVNTSVGTFKYSFKERKMHYIDIIKANEANDNTFELVDLKVDGLLLKYDHVYDKKERVL